MFIKSLVYARQYALWFTCILSHVISKTQTVDGYKYYLPLSRRALKLSKKNGLGGGDRAYQ